MKKKQSKSLPLHRPDLRQHGIRVLDTFHPRQSAVKVNNFHFYVLNTTVFTSSSSILSVNNEKKPDWKNGSDAFFHGMKQAIQLALHALYLADVPLGECIVQRTKDNRFGVVSIRQKSSPLLHEKERNKIAQILNSSNHLPKTFGTDIELLAWHNKSEKWIPASSLLKHNHAVGWDDYLMIKNKKALRPIIELRPDPATSVKQFYKNIYAAYEKVEKMLAAYHLQAIGGSNPYARFLLGGHLHVGNQLASFPLVKRLDAFLTIPFAVLQDDGAFFRRQSHGRLGSVRENRYNGYEYRALPSWYAYIPTFFPVVQWFVYLQTATRNIPEPVLKKDLIAAYYNDNKQRLASYLEEVMRQLQAAMDTQDYDTFARPFFQWLIDNRSQEINATRSARML